MAGDENTCNHAELRSLYDYVGMRDDEDLFGGISMSKEELKKKDIQMKILSMAKDKHRFNYKDEGYHMPDGYVDAKGRIDKAKREGALTARYEEEEQPKTEQVQQDIFYLVPLDAHTLIHTSQQIIIHTPSSGPMGG